MASPSQTTKWAMSPASRAWKEMVTQGDTEIEDKAKECVVTDLKNKLRQPPKEVMNHVICCDHKTPRRRRTASVKKFPQSKRNGDTITAGQKPNTTFVAHSTKVHGANCASRSLHEELEVHSDTAVTPRKEIMRSVPENTVEKRPSPYKTIPWTKEMKKKSVS